MRAPACAGLCAELLDGCPDLRIFATSRETLRVSGEVTSRVSSLPVPEDVPGEYGWVVEGRDYGFSDLSFITTETWPGGGPPLHTHATEEAHVLQRGSYRVLIGERRFDVTGPAAVRIPARVPHTFMNTGDDVIHVVGILPGDSLTYEELGPNPLLSEAADGDASREPERDS